MYIVWELKTVKCLGINNLGMQRFLLNDIIYIHQQYKNKQQPDFMLPANHKYTNTQMFGVGKIFKNVFEIRKKIFWTVAYTVSWIFNVSPSPTHNPQKLFENN